MLYPLHPAVVQPSVTERWRTRSAEIALHAPLLPSFPSTKLPDRTTIINFRHRLEQHQLARQLFESINCGLSDAGIMMTQGTFVDATIIRPQFDQNKRQPRP